MRSAYLKLTAVLAILVTAIVMLNGGISLAAQGTATSAPTTNATLAPTTVATLPATTAVTVAATVTGLPTSIATTAAISAATTGGTASPYPACSLTPTATNTEPTATNTNTPAIAATAQATSQATDTAQPPSEIPSPTITSSPTATTNPSAGYMGVQAETVLTCGARLLDVRPGSPAATAGLQVSDIIVEADGQLVVSADQFRAIIQAHKPGDKVTIIYQRNGNQSTIVVTLGQFPTAQSPTASK